MNRKFLALLWAIQEVVDISDWEMEDLGNLLELSEEEITQLFNNAAELYYDLDD